MSDLEIRTRDDKTNYVPGEELAGEVSWRTDAAPREAELRLFWHTAGKGTQDVEVIETISFDSPARSDRRPFRFTLPESPYSFSGKLVSLIWALELVLASGETERLDIVISPTRNEIALQGG